MSVIRFWSWTPCLGVLLILPSALGATTRPTFETRHELVVDVPEETRLLRVWFVLPQDGGAQRIDNLRIDAPHVYRIVRDSEDNRLLYFEITDRNRELVNRTTPEGYRGPDPELVDYYFGSLEPRRVIFSRGRDLELDPPQANGPVNALPKAYVELDGRVRTEEEGWTRKLTYRERE